MAPAAARRLHGVDPDCRDSDAWFAYTGETAAPHPVTSRADIRCFRHQLLLARPYLVLTKPLRLDIQCQRAASVKIGWKYLDD